MDPTGFNVDTGKLERHSTETKNQIVWDKFWPLINETIQALEAHADSTETNVTSQSVKSRLDDLKNKIIAKEECDQKENQIRSLTEVLLPLAAYDLLKQSNISNGALEKKIIQTAHESLTTLRGSYPNDANLEKLKLDIVYFHDFHESLKKLSASLVKSYG